MAKDPICGMSVSESSIFKAARDGKTHYFCSEHCLKKFTANQKTKWYQNKVVIVASILGALSILSYLLPILEPFRKSLAMYLQRIWWAILIGFILGGVIDYFIPREYVSHILAKPRKRTIFYSVILGFFMSACSHGILALSIELHKKGASNPAVIAFLLASPWANLPFTIMLIAFFGLKALYIIFAAIIIAIITGLIYQVLESKGLIEVNKNIKEVQGGFSIAKDLKKRFSSYKISGIQLKKT